MAEATYTVWIDWQAIPPDAFILDYSQLSNGYALWNIPPAAESDMTSSVRSVSIQRGRSDVLSTAWAGDCTIRLTDPNGEFNPLNEDSTYFPSVRPGKRVRVTATYNGTTYGLFYGFIRAIDYDPDTEETALTCQDLFMFLNRAKPVITSTAAGGYPDGIGVADAISLIASGSINYDHVYITKPDGSTGTTYDYYYYLYDYTSSPYMADGIVLPNFYAQGDKTGIALIQELLTADRGELFVRKDGYLQYRERVDRLIASPVGTLSDVAAQAESSSDIQNVKNRAEVGNGTFTKTATNSASQDNYGPSDAESISSSYITSPAFAESLATWIVTEYGEPSTPMRALSFTANVSDNLMTNAVARELSDKIIVNDSATGIPNRPFFIEGMTHEITNGGKLHTVSYVLSLTRDDKPLVFGTSRSVGGTYSSPTTSSAPYTTTGTQADYFSY